ncbi:hypothetical protein DFJ63DRAFT_5010 [Scheffersomyces coipomensis]|uniref:uncharacterized protein n=1 Tax=Scheffersomyces coipomensis TaxID=1788519 RepID=UPI00315C8AC5
MSSFRRTIDDGDDEDDDELKYQRDELVDFETHNANTNPSNTKKEERLVNLILDHTAFIRGIGNVKRWFNDEYVKTNMNTSKGSITLNIYIPSYTLHEFDFAKKGMSMSASNAREALRFIDKFIESEGEPKENTTNPISYNLIIEGPGETVEWKECLRYKVHSPKVKEFPNFKTKFDYSAISQSYAHNTNANSDDFNSSLSLRDSNKRNDIQYENSESYQNALSHSDNFAEMPTRLRYLLRNCIYKRFVEKNKHSNELEDWKLVTEDPITKIWAKSFGIDCVNVNEAELLMFQNYDVNKFKHYNNFSMEEEYDPFNDILQNTVDATAYSYANISDVTPAPNVTGKKNRPVPIRNRVEGVVNVQPSNITGEYVSKERFDAINFAPRGRGQLWRPGS